LSTSDLYLLNSKSVRHIAEFRNGWGSGPMAWDHLAAKYIPEKPLFALDEAHMTKVWALFEDPRLARHERIALALTFDRSFVAVGDLKAAGEACARFGAECEAARRVNHWPAIGAALLMTAGGRIGPHARGVGLSCTSVCDPWADATPAQLANAWSIFEHLKEPA
jgi:hypothetical protein